jgi:hypothetical protein
MPKKKTEEQTKYANKGVPRNKRPLSNMCYSVEICALREDADLEKYEKYKFKDLGYLRLTWWYETSFRPLKFSHGFIEPDKMKTLIGEKQWGKFCQGKREFIIQRRVDGKNVPKLKAAN